MNGFETRIIDLNNRKEVAAVADFLGGYGLSFDGNVDYTIALYRRETIVATGSVAGKVLRNIAILQELQGEGILSSVVSLLLQEQSRRGIYHSFIYTMPDKVRLFESLGFAEIVRTEPYAAVLELGIGSIAKYCAKIKNAAMRLPPGNTAALVVNCNPFTLGHKALIKRAAKENDAVLVFVVSEDKSLFPFEERYRLVRDGVAEYSNVAVVPGDDYIISAATFPGYFTREENVVTAQTRLDATLFAKHIAPAAGISARYVGQEPYCQVTNTYNQALLDILPRYGIEVRVVERIAVEGEIISASKVREMIRHSDWAGVRKLVPDTTYSYLVSTAAAPVLRKIRETSSRH
jgi:[citrate (pro-3S)-lyase] ligase